MGEGGGGLRLFLVSSVFLGPGLRQTARLAGLVTMIRAWSSGGSCPRQARLLNISSELSLSHSPHPEANTPLSPAGSWPPSVLICDFILPQMGGVTRSWALVQLVPHHLSPPWAVCFSSRGFSLGRPSLSPSGVACPAAWGP